jgi:SET domain-containing protein
MLDFKYETFVDDSIIHGQGRFTKEFIDKGCIVLCIDGNINKNENGSYINHSLDNNLDYVVHNKWQASRDIRIGEELTMNYLQWVKELPF